MAHYSPTRATIMVVDHDEDDVCLLSAILRFKGFDVVQAENGQEAVDIATKSRPALILMELKLPAVSGFTAITRIRKLSNLPDTPIIACSISEPTSHSRLALAAGCVAHLEKPIDFDNLEVLIDQFLPGHRLELTSSLIH